MEAQKNQSEDNIELFLSHISTFDDFRDSDKILYSLEEIILLVFAASLCNCQTYNEMSDFGELRIDWFRRYLPYENGIPSHDTINRVLSLLDSKELEKLLLNWSMKDIILPKDTVISIDGKYLNKSVTAQEQQTKVSEGGKQVVGTLNMYAPGLDMCLASIKIDGRSSERQGAIELLDLMDIKSCILTLDAGFCHHKMVDKVLNKKADYVIGLKNNQKKLCDLVKKLFENQYKSDKAFEQIEKDHGRIEKRKCKVLDIHQIENLADHDKGILAAWNGLTTLIKIESSREIVRKSIKSEQERFYISSKKLGSKEAAKVIREHWAIENNLHWSLDVTLGEDSSTKRKNNAAANYSIFLKMALNHLKKVDKKGVSIKRRVKKCIISEDYLENAIFC